MTETAHQPWEVLESRERLTVAPWLTVRTETIRLPDGRQVEDFVRLEQMSFVCIYPEMPDGRVVCLRQYRHGPKQVCITFPGGHIDRPGESPVSCAQRELLEETGYKASAWIYLGGYCTNANAGGAISHMFRATGCRKVAEADSGDLEHTETVLLTPAELIAAAGKGEMPIVTQISLLALATNPQLAAAVSNLRP